ncbi:MAG: sugar ABC transporter permease [Lachnospiraceae bacterium]|nr:sugar ABC transporter permease [Lachnospiraceae bacterium]MDY3221799.1 sugar ABC transporter permease [Lachnospiraceae bacterium]
MDRKKIYPLYLAVLPAIVFLIFFILPSTVGYYYAFTNWSAVRAGGLKFVGFKNIIDVMTNAKVPVAFANTLIYAGAKTIMVTILGFIFAYVLNRDIKTKTALRTIYFVPSIFSCLVVGLIFSAVFQTRHGTLNNILNIFGIANIQWLGSRGTAVFAICMAEIWRNVGYAIIITLAGMQSVSSDYIEAAKLDGASEWQVFKNVTLPLIMPTVNVNILFSLIYGLKMFDLIYVMTGGGPGNATESFGTLIMNEMSAGRYAQSVAVNLVFTVILVAVSMLYQKFSSRWEKVE